MRVLLLAAALLAAAQSDTRLSFEAASVKPNQSATCDRDGSFAGGRFAMTCSTLHELVVVAYTRQDGRTRSDAEIAGGPSWLTNDHFDVLAKLPEGRGVDIDTANAGAAAVSPALLSTISQMRGMLRTLLTDRFKLSVHNELRDLPVYELQLDRRDGGLGPRMKKVDVDCVAQRTARVPPPGNGGPCGGFRVMEQGHIIGHAVTVAVLGQFLELPVSRNVLDRTGLRGTFDVELQYAPPNDTNGVSVFTAVREQLGLKLESTKAPVDVLVIDRAEKPTAD